MIRSVRWGVAAAVAAATWVGAVTQASAQEHAPVAGYAFLAEGRWGKIPAADAGKRFYIEGRWHQLYGDWILLYKGAINTRGFLWVSPQSGALKQVLAADKDSGGAGLRGKRSSVRIFGVAKKAGSRVVLQVERVEKLPDESEQYRTRLAGLGEDVDAVAELAKECATRAERFGDEALVAVGHTIVARELELRTAKLDAADYAGHMALAQRYLDEVEDPAGAIALYAHLVEEVPSLPGAVRQRVLARLERLKAVRAHREGKWTWLPYAEFKAAEGFVAVRAGGEVVWQRREEVEFRAIRAAELELQKRTLALPRTNPTKHAKDARQGLITRGQTYAEVRIAGGLPVFVRHHMQPYQQADKEVPWTQWILEDGRRIYFADGEVIATRGANEPWLNPEN